MVLLVEVSNISVSVVATENVSPFFVVTLFLIILKGAYLKYKCFFSYGLVFFEKRPS